MTRAARSSMLMPRGLAPASISCALSRPSSCDAEFAPAPRSRATARARSAAARRRRDAALDHRGDVVQLAVRRRIAGCSAPISASVSWKRGSNISARGRRRSAGASIVDLHHEAVARRRRDLERLLALDAVAVGEHQQVRKAELAVERRDAALGHHAQQQRMHLRAGAVDLVEEEDRELLAVRDQRAGLDRRPAVGADVGVVDQVVAASGRSCPRCARTRRRAPARRRAAASSCRRRHRLAAARGRARTPRSSTSRITRALADHRLADLALERQRACAPVVQQRIVAIHA